MNVVLGCEDVVVVPQYKGTCWFNAVLMMLFYSEATRGVLLGAPGLLTLRESERTSAKRLERLFSKMLGMYKRPAGTMAHRWFDRHPPEEVLYLLNRYNPRRFDKKVLHAADGTFEAPAGFGGQTYRYLYELLRLLGVPSVMLDAVPATGDRYGPFRLAVGKAHSGKAVLSRAGIARKVASRPAILLVALGNQGLSRWKRRPLHHFLSTRVYSGLPHALLFGGAQYVLDSVSLSNVNNGEEFVDRKGRPGATGGHAIAGVTCNSTRFIYSGWMRKTVDAASDVDAVVSTADRPCPLMPFDWASDPTDFYVTSKACDVQFEPPKPGAVRFNASWGSRTLVYVRQDLVRYKRDGLRRAMHAGRSGDRTRALAMAAAVGRQAVANAFRRRERIA